MKKNFFIYGDDISRVNDKAAQILDDLKKKFSSYEIRKFLCGEDELSGIKNYITSFSMFSKGKIAVIENIEAASKNIDYLIKEILTPPSDAVLLLTCGDAKVKKLAALKKAFTKNGGEFTRVYNLNARGVEQEIKKIIKENNLKITKEAFFFLMRVFKYVNTNFYQIKAAMENIMNYANGKEITEDMVREQAGVDVNFTVFELRDALFKKDLAKSLVLTEQNTQSPSDFLQGALFWIIRTAGNLNRLKKMAREGNTKSKILSQLGIMEFEYANLVKFGAAFSEEKLKEIVYAAYLIQRRLYSVKAASLMPDFEALIFRICERKKAYA